MKGWKSSTWGNEIKGHVELAESPNARNRLHSLDAVHATADWCAHYISKLKWVNAGIVAAAVLAAQVVHFGLDKSDYTIRLITLSHCVYGIILRVIWNILLGACYSRKIRVGSTCSEEYKINLTATTLLFGTVVTLPYAFSLDNADGYMLLALTLGICGVLHSLWTQRPAAHRQRGYFTLKVLLLTGTPSAAHLIKSLSRHPSTGFERAAVHVLGVTNGPLTHTVRAPTVGTGQAVEFALDSISRNGANTVALSSGNTLSPDEIRALGDRRFLYMMAPALTDAAGPGVTVQFCFRLAVGSRFDASNQFRCTIHQTGVLHHHFITSDRGAIPGVANPGCCRQARRWSDHFQASTHRYEGGKAPHA